MSRDTASNQLIDYKNSLNVSIQKFVFSSKIVLIFLPFNKISVIFHMTRQENKIPQNNNNICNTIETIGLKESKSSWRKPKETITSCRLLLLPLLIFEKGGVVDSWLTFGNVKKLLCNHTTTFVRLVLWIRKKWMVIQ